MSKMALEFLLQGKMFGVIGWRGGKDTKLIRRSMGAAQSKRESPYAVGERSVECSTCFFDAKHRIALLLLDSLCLTNGDTVAHQQVLKIVSSDAWRHRFSIISRI